MKTLVTTKMIDDAKQRLKIIKTNLKHHKECEKEK